jgi:hypothetical protein
MRFLLAHAPYIHTCRTKHSRANPKIDFRWPRSRRASGIAGPLQQKIAEYCMSLRSTAVVGSTNSFLQSSTHCRRLWVWSVNGDKKYVSKLFHVCF